MALCDDNIYRVGVGLSGPADVCEDVGPEARRQRRRLERVSFFQASLLLGYLYAHVTTRWLGERRQAMAHLLLMMAALAFLPLTLGDGSPPAGSDPVWWLLVTMFTRLGLPFFTVATMAPLVQRWFATLPVPSAANPYFLYSASNIGSMMALLAYPLILEPFWGTQVHSDLWLLGYGALLVMTTACIVCVNRNGNDIAAAEQRSAGLSCQRRARWTMLAFIPSSLMLGVTTHINRPGSHPPFMGSPAGGVPADVHPRLLPASMVPGSDFWHAHGPFSRLR